MGFLSKIFGGKKKQAAVQTPADSAACGHLTLVPRWGSAEDMGKASKVTTYVCESCRQEFSREEGDRIREETSKSLLG